MRTCCTRLLTLLLVVQPSAVISTAVAADDKVDFNRDVRPILSSACLTCHGPDAETREAGLRLDDRTSAQSELDSGSIAVVAGDAAASELIARITSDDEDLLMPPAASGQHLTADQIDTLTRWINQGAQFSAHWSYVPPSRPDVPRVPDDLATWPQNPIDHFTLQKMRQHDLQPSPEADLYALVRRIHLDLTGLPPTIEEADAFASSQDPDAYEQLVDDLLQRDSFGEHWARKWLDLARYADSAGYADDPPRTIWAYRDWVIRAINSNMPFDQFTIEQMAGDLLPDATDDQVIATAFHRNTLTNSEGGTIDEEFRNVAVVDRVNTTFAVWMGTTMGCAQCHTHKYDPITQDEYFGIFAILNNTQDADRRDETPLLQVYSSEQRHQRRKLQDEIDALQQVIATATPELAQSQTRWETGIQTPSAWQSLKASKITRASGEVASIDGDGTVLVTSATEKDTYTVELPLPDAQTPIAALQIETLPHESIPGQGGANGTGLSSGNFVITGVKAQLVPLSETVQQARYVRITNVGERQFLSLAEVEVFSGSQNVAGAGKASQVSTDYSGPPELAIDGNTNGNYADKSTTHTAQETNPWWELDLGELRPIDALKIWNRTDNNLHVRLKDFRVELLNEARDLVWQTTVAKPPNPSSKYATTGATDVRLVSAFADYHQDKFEPAEVVSGKTGNDDGWAIGGKTGEPHQLILVPADSINVDQPSLLRVTIEQNSPHANHLLGHFRLAVTSDDNSVRRSRLPQDLIAVLDQPTDQRSADDAARFSAYYRRHVASELDDERRQLNQAETRLKNVTPMTSVPVMREVTDNRRETLFQYRGNWQSTGHQVTEGVPAAFHPIAARTPDRMALAEWLIDPENPLTARVLVNRYWETLFGRGLVATSEDFGSQGEPPTHPQLLDWLATEVIRLGWDRKAILKQIVMSATYRQTARVTPEAVAADSDNHWLTRGPRIRLSAEMVRDQALFVSGLLSPKMYGAPVKPPQPSQGLRAAFGSSTDWKPSEGEDRHRRGLYTSWRRSNPYPSMATFDAPNREVCTVRRNSTNTPLQSLVTLNDPVYVEAAQALARLALQEGSTDEEQLTYAFRRCLLRSPTQQELTALMQLLLDARARLTDQNDEAMKLATDPLGPLPEGITTLNAAAMTVVGNVLLNLDEMFLKR